MSAIEVIEDDVLELVAVLAQCKGVERDAAAKRIAAEEALAKALEFEDAVEGSESYKVIGKAGEATVTLKQPINRSVNTKMWQEIRKGLPREVCDTLMRSKYELNLTALRDLQKSDPTTWGKVSECVTARPGKVGVEIKELVLQ